MAQTCFRLWLNMVEGLTVGRAKAHITTEAFNIAPSLVMRGRTRTAVKEIHQIGCGFFSMKKCKTM